MPDQDINQIIQALSALENVTLHMQERGKRINVRAYTGYDRENKRSSYALLGSVDNVTFEPNDRLASILSGSERIAEAYAAAVEQFRAERKSEYEKNERSNLKNSVSWYAKRLAEGLEATVADGDVITAEAAASVYAAIKRAEVVLRKSGHKKTKTGDTGTKKV
ncbi:hypothetical protein ACOKR6_16735 [Vibrio cholerae]